MWPYYGSKGGVINYYPPPKYGKIYEPFAGSARYSLKYFDREIILVDQYPVIVSIWKWLQLCSPGDIQKLPRLKEGEDIRDFKLDCQEAIWLMGFIAGVNQFRPINKASARATTQRPTRINNTIKRIAADLWKIKHWDIRLGSYTDLPNDEATWFIDPPYQTGGHKYIYNKIDYKDLAKWCIARRGQAIVCENTSADWLPFLPMKQQRGNNNTTVEAIWSNHETQYSFLQQKFLEA